MSENKISKIEQLLIQLRRSDLYNGSTPEYQKFRAMFPLSSDVGKEVDPNEPRISAQDLNEFLEDPETTRTLPTLINRMYRYYPEIVHRIVNGINSNAEAKNGMSNQSRRVFERFEELVKQTQQEVEFARNNLNAPDSQGMYENFYENKIAKVLKANVEAVEDFESFFKTRSRDSSDQRRLEENLERSDAVVRAMFPLKGDGSPEKPVDSNTKPLTGNDLMNLFEDRNNKTLMMGIAGNLKNRNLPNRIVNAVNANPELKKGMSPEALKVFGFFEKQVIENNRVAAESSKSSGSEVRETKSATRPVSTQAKSAPPRSLPEHLNKALSEFAKRIQSATSTISVARYKNAFSNGLPALLVDNKIIKSESEAPTNRVFKYIMDFVNSVVGKKVEQMNQKQK